MAEQKVVASLFQFLWPPEVYGCNPITIDVGPRSCHMRRESISKPMTYRFNAHRMKWQCKTVAEKVISHASYMKQLCSSAPSYLKQLAVLFFNLARIFVATHCEPYVAPNGTVRQVTKQMNRSETVDLLSKTTRYIETFRRNLRRTHKAAGIVYTDGYLDDAFRAVLQSTEALLADMTILVSHTLCMMTPCICKCWNL